MENTAQKDLLAASFPGWFSTSECRSLYSLTMSTKGDILEIGHFLGRSTACICQGIRDSKTDRKFNSYDMAFRSADEFRDFFRVVHKKEIEPDAFLLELVFPKESTATIEAGINLEKYSLKEYVNLISGDFSILDKTKYDLIFCDAVHEPNEIKLNIKEIERRSNDRCLWAFHDMNAENIDLILNISNVIYIDLIDSLGIFMYYEK